MKKTALLLLFILPFLSFSQDALTYKNGGRIFNYSNQKLTPKEVRDLLSTNAEALSLYNSGKTKQTVGNTLLYGGLSTIVLKHVSMLNKYYGSNSINVESNNILYFVGGAMVLIAISIKLGFQNKIKKAVSLINEDLKNPKTGFNIESTSFISNSNGFGISITF